MAISRSAHATRRHLPHIEKPGADYFVTFSTIHRIVLAPPERDIVYRTCLYEHGRTSFIHCLTIMPDHVHIVFMPFEIFRLPQLMQRIKGVSAHRLKRGVIWQDESCDRVVRNSENLRKKCEYVCSNPVRAGLVSSPDEYPWTWREWIEGRTGEGACPPQAVD